MSRLVHRLGLFQGVVYVVTGIWPLIDIDSFMWVTGPKNDLWLVRTVGLLITATGITLLLAVRRREVTTSIAILAILNALFLAGVDTFYALTDVISNIYLMDAVLELGLVATWIFAIRSGWTATQTS